MLNNINDIYYIKFALQFTDKQIPELVTLFNTQTQSRAWSSMRAAVYDGKTISFAHPVRYDTNDNKLVVIG